VSQISAAVVIRLSKFTSYRPQSSSASRFTAGRGQSVAVGTIGHPPPVVLKQIKAAGTHPPRYAAV
jgi:hypothetical protein